MSSHTLQEAALRYKRRAASGDEKEAHRLAEKIIAHLSPRIRSVASKWIQPPHVLFEDLEQAGRLAVTLALHCYDPNTGVDFLGYVVLCIENSIRNTARDLRRVGIRCTACVGDGEEAGVYDPPAPDAFAAVEAAILIEQLLPQLCPTQREALTLRYLEGLTLEEIAARVGCSYVHVRRRILAGLARLREILEEN